MSEKNDTLPLIDACLGRVAAGEKGAWDELMTLAFDRLLAQCERIVGRQLSRPNPLLTANSVAAETYLRLRTAVDNESARPTTAKQFFGLTARNISWQIQDMLRKPASQQGDDDVLAGLTGGSGVTTDVLEREKWRRFWEAVDGLPPDQREVFDLVYIHDLSQYEAADLLGKTRNQVDSLWRKVKLAIVQACPDLVGLPG